MNHRKINPGVGVLLIGVAGAGVLAGCRGDREDKPPHQFFPDMDDSPKWTPQSRSEFFADSRTMRQPVAGTVAFGRTEFVSEAPWAHPFMAERDDLLREDSAVYFGKNADGSWVERIPITVDAALLKRGQERFNITCAVCHGYEGDGQGMVGKQWSYPLPNFHDAKYRVPDPAIPAQQQWKDGYIFNVSRNGVPNADPTKANKMPGYAHAFSEHDSWAIVAYIRTLQAARAGSIDDVPEAQRRDLLNKRPSPATDNPGAGGAK